MRAYPAASEKGRIAGCAGVIEDAQGGRHNLPAKVYSGVTNQAAELVAAHDAILAAAALRRDAEPLEVVLKQGWQCDDGNDLAEIIKSDGHRANGKGVKNFPEWRAIGKAVAAFGGPVRFIRGTAADERLFGQARTAAKKAREAAETKPPKAA